MSFIGTLLVLAAVVAAVLVPMFFGHALSTHDSAYFLLAAILAAVAALLMTATLRVERRRSRRDTSR